MSAVIIFSLSNVPFPCIPCQFSKLLTFPESDSENLTSNNNFVYICRLYTHKNYYTDCVLCDMNSKSIKDLILNIRKPHRFKGIQLPWKCFDMTIDEWCASFDEDFCANSAGVNFEIGKNLHNQDPQWEKYRSSLKMTLSEFLEMSNDDVPQESWSAYSYKNINECPINCREGVNFSVLGFENIEDISFWLGSKGAHTSCHYDTYGCNIVVQVYGKYVHI